MLTFILNTKSNGKLLFTVNDKGGYIKLNNRQICVGGKFKGETIKCKGDVQSLEEHSRKWWKAHLRIKNKS